MRPLDVNAQRTHLLVNMDMCIPVYTHNGFAHMSQINEYSKEADTFCVQ